MGSHRSGRGQTGSTDNSHGYLLVALAGISWGTTGTIARSLMDMGIGSRDVSFMRMFFGFIFLLAYMLLRDRSGLRLDRKGIVISAALGIFGHLGFNYAYFYAVDQIGISAATVLLYLAPLFLMFLSRVIFKEKLNGVKIAGVVLCVAGSYLAVRGASPQFQYDSVIGVALGLISALIYAFISIVSKIAVNKYRPDSIVLYSFLFGAIGAAAIDPPIHLVAFLPSKDFLLAGIGIGTLSSSVAYVLYFKGIKCEIELSKAGVISVLELVVSVLLAVLVVGETMDYVKGMGIVLIVVAIATIQYSDKILLLTHKNSKVPYEKVI